MEEKQHSSWKLLARYYPLVNQNKGALESQEKNLDNIRTTTGRTTPTSKLWLHRICHLIPLQDKHNHDKISDKIHQDLIIEASLVMMDPDAAVAVWEVVWDVETEMEETLTAEEQPTEETQDMVQEDLTSDAIFVTY